MAGGSHGGAETAFVDMCIALHESGETICVITRPNDLRVARLREAGIEVHTVRMGGRADAYSHWVVRRIIKKFKPTIIQSWMSRGARYTPSWSKRMGIPPYVTFARLGGYYNLKNYKNIEHFVAITPKIKDYLLSEGVAEEKIHFIRNFAEVEPVEEPIDRKEYGVPKDGFLIVALGRLHEAKAHDVLIEAVKGLDDVYVWIAGEGDERDSLQKQIDDAGLAGRVQLLGWRSDRAALLQAADLCAFISRFEPFGTVFVQAWAQKTPVMVSDADGPIQFVKNDENGVVVPKEDVLKTREAIVRLRDDKKLRKSLVENGYSEYQEYFSKDKTIQQYLDVYHRTLSEKTK